MKLLKAGRPSNKKEKAIASVQETQSSEYERMSINILKTFHKQVKQRALDENTTITAIVIRALEAYLNK